MADQGMEHVLRFSTVTCVTLSNCESSETDNEDSVCTRKKRLNFECVFDYDQRAEAE